MQIFNMVEYSDKNSRNFASLEKKRSESRLISSHQIDNKINTDQRKSYLKLRNTTKIYILNENLDILDTIFDETIPEQAEQENLKE